MRWDNKRQRYVDNGRVMSEAQVRREVADYVEGERAKVKHEAVKVGQGDVTVAAFFRFMRERMETWHWITGAIAYGGKAQMDAERWARIEEKIKSEKAYLANFERELMSELTNEN